MSGAAVVVELIGLSGSGKTTLIRGTHRLLGDEGLPVRMHLDRLRPPLSGVGAAALGVRPSVALWCAANRRRAGSEAGRLFLRSLAYARRLRRTPGIHLLDEGPLKLGTLFVPRSRLRSTILRSMPRPDLVVLVGCDADVRIQRIRAKKKPHARGLSDQEMRARHHRGVRRIGWLVDAYRTCGVPVLEIDTTDGGDHAASLAARVHRLAATRGLAPQTVRQGP